MKKITFLSFILVLIISSYVQAFQWPYSFVAWDGKEYEVKKEELLQKSEIGKRIGKVKTQPYPLDSDLRIEGAMTYSGDASNVYPIGTPYYKIKGVSTSTSIAVKVGKEWIRADYVQDAPQHVVDPFTKILHNIVPVVIIGLILIGFIYRSKKLKNRQNQFKMKSPLL